MCNLRRFARIAVRRLRAERAEASLPAHAKANNQGKCCRNAALHDPRSCMFAKPKEWRDGIGGGFLGRPA